MASSIRRPDAATPGAGTGACPTCRGRLREAAEVSAKWPEVELAPETRLSSSAFKRTRRCPACEAPLAPLRIGDQEAWVERCPGCDHLWLDALDPPVLDRLQRRGRLVGAVAALLGVFLLAPLKSLVFVAGHGSPWHAFTALFAHFGWLHLLGNVYFLVVIGFMVTVGRLPIVVFGVLEVTFQLAMRGLGVPGVGFTAHLAGLALGVAVGLGWRAAASRGQAAPAG